MAALLPEDIGRVSPEGLAHRPHPIRELPPSGRTSALPFTDSFLAAFHALPTVRVESGLQRDSYGPKHFITCFE